MGFFSDLFGGTDRSQLREQRKANIATQDFIEQQSGLARGDLLRLFPQAEQATRAGTQAALDVFGQTIPQQFGAFQQGNVGAQDILAQGVRGSRAALLGLPFQENFQAQRIPINTQFAQQQLPASTFQPQQQTPQQSLGGLPPEILRLIQGRA